MPHIEYSLWQLKAAPYPSVAAMSTREKLCEQQAAVASRQNKKGIGH